MLDFVNIARFVVSRGKTLTLDVVPRVGKSFVMVISSNFNMNEN